MALIEVNDKQYTSSMINSGISQIIKLGIAFYKKQAEVAYALESL